MVKTCVVFGCTARFGQDSDRTFHSFPFSDPERLHKWVQNVSRVGLDGKPWKPAKHSQICSDHFLKTDYKETKKNKILKKTAVPTVFPSHPPHKQTNRKPRQSPKKRPCPDKEATEEPIPHLTNKFIKLTEHNYCCPSAETALQKTKEQLEENKKVLAAKNMRIKSLTQKLKRRDVKISKLLVDMKSEHVLSDEQHDSLKANFDESTMVLLENELKSSHTSKYGMRYSEDLKKFAVTLHFYSHQAYDYVRKYLNLPHPSSIQKWASSRQCNPGFLSEVLATLKATLTSDTQDIVIMFDGMHLKKGYTYDMGRKEYVGSVDLGHLNVGTSDVLAGESLTFMVVGLKKHFKQPIGYFLVDKVSAATQAQMVKDAIILMHEIGYVVHGVVCDGNYTNQATATLLGCNLDPFYMINSFNHPITQEPIFFFFDACHLIKNVRNCLGDLKVIKSKEKQVAWQFIIELDKIQRGDNLVLANKLRGKHVNFNKNKMNVKFAVQTISRSVANAIDFLREDLNLSNFRNSEGTTEFIRLFDVIFDICNSSSPFGRGSKRPFYSDNLLEREIFVDDACQYISTLSDVTGRLLVNGKRKTGFVGFICTLKSTIALSKKLLGQGHNYRFFMTYRLSQDHLETFFSRMRRRNGWNNNPSPAQFKWSLRSLLLKNGILPSAKANCVLVEEPANQLLLDDVAKSAPANKSLEMFTQILSKPSVYHDQALYYISGFVARKVADRLKCSQCMQVLHTKSDDSPDSLFTRRCSFGGLLMCKDMYTVVKSADKYLRHVLVSDGPIKGVKRNLIPSVINHVLKEVSKNVFGSIWEHSRDNHNLETEDNHVHQIIKEACKLYSNMILHHHEKIIADRFIHNDQGSQRHKLTKTVLFLHL